MVADHRVPLVSATGSTAMGRQIGPRIAARLGRSLLELGGNNAVIVMDDADLRLALTAVAFGAVGTAGQRCTTTRRLFLQKGIAAGFTERLVAAYAKIPIGDPTEPGTMCGPLIDRSAVETFRRTIDAIRRSGGEILCGGNVIERPGNYVEPTIVRVAARGAPWRCGRAGAAAATFDPRRARARRHDRRAGARSRRPDGCRSPEGSPHPRPAEQLSCRRCR